MNGDADGEQPSFARRQGAKFRIDVSLPQHGFGGRTAQAKQFVSGGFALQRIGSGQL